MVGSGASTYPVEDPRRKRVLLVVIAILTACLLCLLCLFVPDPRPPLCLRTQHVWFTAPLNRWRDR